MSKLVKTVKDSQFIRLHDNSKIADKIFTYHTPTINDKPIEVLQVLCTNSEKYNMIIEFIYIDKKEI